MVLRAASRARCQQVPHRQARQGRMHQRERHALREVVVGAKEKVIRVGVAQQAGRAEGAQRISRHRSSAAMETQQIQKQEKQQPHM